MSDDDEPRCEGAVRVGTTYYGGRYQTDGSAEAVNKRCDYRARYRIQVEVHRAGHDEPVDVKEMLVCGHHKRQHVDHGSWDVIEERDD